MGLWWLVLVPLALFFSSCATHRHPDWCGTTKPLVNSNATEKRDTQAVCGTGHRCDLPGVRYEYRIRPGIQTLIVKILWIVFGHQDPLFSGQITAQMESVKEFFDPALISFSARIRWINDPEYNGIYSPFDAVRMDSMKLTYADSPSTTLNIFVPGGLDYGVTGFATFPHNPNALNYTGGIVMDRQSVGEGKYAFIHQLGHIFGLYHTFEGAYEAKLADSGEVQVFPTGEIPCDVCAEFAGQPSDYKGDLCSDTPPTDENYKCQDPGTYDCNYQPYENTDFMNPMGYGPDSCIEYGGFTDQQIARMRCFLESPSFVNDYDERGLSTWVTNPACKSNADCNDNNMCTTDTCVDGVCVFTEKVCTTNKPCFDASCDVDTGLCVVTNRTCDNIVPDSLRNCAKSRCNPLRNECRLNVKACGTRSNYQSDCCRKSREPFCSDINIANCVCTIQPSCCVDRWDQNCVLAVSNCGRDCLAEKIPYPNNTECPNSLDVELSENVLYSKNSAHDWANFTCYGKHVYSSGVWYTYRATSSKIVEINTCYKHNNIEAHVFVFTNCSHDCMLWGEGSESCAKQAIVEFYAEEGINYTIFIASNQSGVLAVRIDETPRRGWRGGAIAALVVSLVVFFLVLIIAVLAFVFKDRLVEEKKDNYTVDYN